MPWTNHAKDRLFAPKLSQLTGCDIPALDTTPERSKHFLTQFVLTSALRLNIPDPHRQLIFSFLRRVDGAVLQYWQGRIELMQFMSTDTRPISGYSRALFAFESALARACQSALLLSQIHDDKPSLFDKKDGSVMYRIDRLYNADKHADQFIANGGRFADNSTLPVWFVNEGLESIDAVVTFHELAETINGMSRAARQLAAMTIGDSPNDTGGEDSED